MHELSLLRTVDNVSKGNDTFYQKTRKKKEKKWKNDSVVKASSQCGVKTLVGAYTIIYTFTTKLAKQLFF